MKNKYSPNELAQMTGFITRTLRNYLNQGILKGTKMNGKWQFTAEELDSFYREPFVKEGLRIKHSSVVFDFMSVLTRKEERSCIILDIPCSAEKGNKISSFFCKQVCSAESITFKYSHNDSMCRVILSGSADETAEIMKNYYAAEFSHIKTIHSEHTKV